MMTDIKGFKMKRMAFTMLELVFVIVVLGILAALAMPRLDRDLKQEAADSILSNIRYTQHLALTDNKHKFNLHDWHKALWQIRFSQSGGDWSYTVATNMDRINNLDEDEAAIDPSTGKLMHSTSANASPNIFLTKKYGISTIDFTNCNVRTGSTGTSGTVQHIAFDNLGRPHRGVFGATNTYSTIMHEDCIIRFTLSNSETFDINITKETGYAYIDEQDDS